jgi:hypothetical protein
MMEENIHHATARQNEHIPFMEPSLMLAEMEHRGYFVLPLAGPLVPKVPVISEYKNFSMSPACVALHYALQCFEGMKAYKDKEGRVRLFRPDKNMARMNSSMARLSMPALDEQGYLECIKQVGVRIALMVSHCI